MQNDTRNTVVFIVCAMVLLILYQTFILGPGQKQKTAELKQKQAEAARIEAQTKAGATPDANAPLIKVPRSQAVAAAQRVPVRSAALTGSISLTGGRIDDLFLNKYKQKQEAGSPNVELFTPAGAANAWFAEFGWAGANVPGLPKGDTVWTVKEGQTLTPQTPVTLTYTSPQGLVFTRKLAVDDNYLFTITDTVANTSGQAVSIAPYGSVQRQGLSPEAGKGQNVHEGAIGVLGGDLVDRRYKDWKKKADKARTENTVDKSLVFNSTGGWLGITDKYWLAAIIPDQKEKLDAKYTVTPSQGVDIYDTNYVGQARTIQPGAQVTETTHLFAGAKRVETLKAYGKQLGAPRFDWAVDWGKLSFLTRPFFTVLEFFFSHLGNFGLAILAMTFCVRLLLFPLANKSYESMSKMKKLAGPAAELKEKYKDDPAKLQQETMALYQREKVNPLVGCIPIVLQIPIFLAFYKVLSVTIEMRQAPFFGWIHDLSSRDPTTIFNLFGAIPWNPATAPLIGGILDGNLHLGVLPLLYGFTMWLTTAMNPPAPDPMQQRIFQLMPIFFTFIMAPFAVGLLIYWTFSNCFSIIQQYVIMHRLKVENPIDNFFARFSGKEKASA